MAHAYHHAVSSSRKFGGDPDEYLKLHEWLDASKSHMADFRHRALRHHSEGIFMLESLFWQHDHALDRPRSPRAVHRGAARHRRLGQDSDRG